MGGSNETDHCLVEGGAGGTEPCRRWDWDRSTWPETVVSQFSLVQADQQGGPVQCVVLQVCGRDYWRSMSQSLYMVGVMVGSFGSGILSDKFGRKRVGALH